MESVTNLGLDYQFEVIPDCTAVTNSDYSEADRAEAKILSMVECDGSLYYLAAANCLASILIARRKVDGCLLFAVSCNDYTLDTSGGVVVCRLTIYNDYLLLSTISISNIGPQIFCVDCQGSLVWAIAYQLPIVISEAFGVTYLTTRGDYSYFRGCNAAICGGDLQVTSRGKCCKTLRIYAGSASLQHCPSGQCCPSVQHCPGMVQHQYNPGMVQGIHYCGYPFYTDCSGLTLIEVIAGRPTVSWTYYTCPLPLRVGDRLTKNVDDSNPFAPRETTVKITTLAVPGSRIVSPVAVDGKYTFIQRISNKCGNVSEFWSQIGSNISVDDTGNTYFLTEALALLSGEGGYLRACLDYDARVTGALVSGEFGVYYIKQLRVGDVIANKYDANGLGYWGNCVSSLRVQEKKGYVLIGTGCAQSIPISEQEYYAIPTRNYSILQRPAIQAHADYLASPSADGLNQYTALLLQLSRVIQKLPANRSPRGQMSYTDSVVGISSESGRILFGLRTMGCDVIGNPLPITPLSTNDINAGVVLGTGNTVVTALGQLLTFKLDKLTRCVFDHYDLESTGVSVNYSGYLGPNLRVVGYAGNVMAVHGQGKYICPQGNSYSLPAVVGLAEGRASWVRSVGNAENVIVDGDCAYVGGTILDCRSGEIVWQCSGNDPVVVTPERMWWGNQCFTPQEALATDDYYDGVYTNSTRDITHSWQSVRLRVHHPNYQGVCEMDGLDVRCVHTQSGSALLRYQSISCINRERYVARYYNLTLGCEDSVLMERNQ
jgi:hypothetical protein